MKKIQLIIAAFLLLLGCKNSIEVSTKSQEATNMADAMQKNRELAIQRNKPYQQRAAAVELYIAPNQELPDIEAHNTFVESVGIPKSNNFYEWQQTNNPSSSIQKYKEATQKNASHKYIQFLRQYASWLFITHYDLLSHYDNAKEVKFLLDELITAQYKGYPLIFDVISYLKSNNSISTQEIEKIHNTILGYKKTNEPTKSLLDVNMKQPGGKPYPPGVIEKVNARILEKNAAEDWIDKIRLLASE